MPDSSGNLISYGVHEMVIDGAGSTIDEVIAMHKQIMNLPDNVHATVNGQRVDGDYRLKAGEQVEFIKEAGEKGEVN